MNSQKNIDVLKLVIILTFAFGIFIVLAGIFLFFFGATDEIVLTLFGQELTTKNVGVAAIFIGTVFIATTFNNALKKLGLKENGKQPLRVAIAIIIKDKQVLLVKRKHAHNNLRWQFPTGIIRHNIPKEDVVKGETEKETGAICDISRCLGNRTHPDTKADAYYYLCDYVSGEIDNLQPEENEEVKWVDAKDVKKYITTDLYEPVEKALESLN